MRGARANFLSDAGGTAIGLLVQAGLLMVLSRVADVNEFAIYLSAAAVVAIAEISADFGTRVRGLGYFATGSTDPGLRSLLAGKYAYAILTLLVLPQIPMALLTPVQLLLCGAIAVTQTSNDPLLWYVQGRDRFDISAVWILFGRVSVAGVLAVLAWQRQAAATLLEAWLSMNLLRILGELFLSSIADEGWRRNWSLPFSASAAWSVFRSALPIGTAFVLLSLFHRLGVLTLGRLGDTTQVAMYGATFSMVSASAFVGVSVTNVLFPRLSRAIDRCDWRAAEHLLGRQLLVITLIFVPAGLVGMLLAPWVVPLLLGKKYLAAVPVMICLLAGNYISTISFSLKFALNALHRNWWDVASTAVAIVVFFAFTFSRKGGADAIDVGIAWGLGESSAFLFKWWTLKMDGRLRSTMPALCAVLGAMLALAAWQFLARYTSPVVLGHG